MFGWNGMNKCLWILILFSMLIFFQFLFLIHLFIYICIYIFLALIRNHDSSFLGTEKYWITSIFTIAQILIYIYSKFVWIRLQTKKKHRMHITANYGVDQKVRKKYPQLFLHLECFFCSRRKCFMFGTKEHIIIVEWVAVGNDGAVRCIHECDSELHRRQCYNKSHP